MPEQTFTPAKIEQIVILERLYLYNRALPCGAFPIRQLMESYGVRPLPSLSTIKRILSRNHRDNSVLFL